LILYVLASIGCALVNTADGLIVMRFLQAIGGCSGMVAASALVRDLFPVEKTAQAFSWIMLVIAVSPMVAPALGGYVTAAFGWHSIFLILAAMVVLILIACHFYLPAGQGPDTSLSLRPRPVVANFVSVMRQPQFLLYTLAGGITAAALFAYIAGSADVFMNQFGASEEEYGWIFAIIACFMIGSTQLNHLLLRHFTSAQIIRTVLIGQAVVGRALVGGTAFEMLGKYEMAALIALFFTGQGLTNPNFNALSLAPFTRNTGSAASLAGSFRMAAGGVITGLVSLLYNRTPMPMIGVMVGCVGVGLVVLLVGTSMRSFKEQALGTI
jgi:DHA1 family bicyclomycin/chloramphenicol resistance-like MFS transporter